MTTTKTTHPVPNSPVCYEKSIGSKYESGRDVADVARLVRADLKAEGIKAKVRISRYSMGCDLTVEITDAPINVINLARALDHDTTEPRFSEEGLSLLRRAEGIVEAYQRKVTEHNTDYYESNFHSTVRFAYTLEDAHKAEIAGFFAPVQ